MSSELQAELGFLQKLLLLFYFTEFKRPILSAEPNNMNNIRFRKSTDFQYSSHILSAEFTCIYTHLDKYIGICTFVYV